MKQLNIRDVCKTLDKRKETREETFVKILEKCYVKIERAVSADALFLFYEVPQFVWGSPLYDLNQCIGFMKEKLQANGFLVKYFFPNIVYVSWNKAEIEEEKLQSKLRQAKALDSMLLLNAPPKPPPSITHEMPLRESSDASSTQNYGGCASKILEFPKRGGGGGRRGGGRNGGGGGRGNKIFLDL